MPKEKFDRSKPHVHIGTIGHIHENDNSLISSVVKEMLKTKNNGNLKKKVKNKSPYGKKYF